jgi:2-methylcitrate dehydratase PrpD
MTLTGQLTELGLGRKSGEITSAAYAAAKKMLLDTLGCALAGRDEPGVREVVEQMRDWGGKPEATVLFAGSRVPAPSAAFANSTMIHALDLDDVYIPASLHITSIIVPAMLAAAEMADVSGRDALAGLIMGIEVAGRLGIAGRDRRRSGAFLPSSCDGGFGAVVTAARLLRMSPQQCVDAMGINYAQVSGNRQALLDMSLTKRIQPALAVRSALWAVALAQRGLTGPDRALEGECGYFNAYLNGDVPDGQELIAEKQWYEIENDAIKHYPSCGACHSAHAAADRLKKEEGLQADDIQKVELFGCGPGGLVGRPFSLGRNPQVDAQFSVAYGVALALIRGPMSLDRFTDAAVVADREVVELAKAITFVPKPPDVPEKVVERPPDYGAYTPRPHGVIVYTKDGRRLVRYQCPAQTFEAMSVTFDDVVPKFRACAAYAGVTDAARVEAMVEAVRDLDSAPSITGLAQAFGV